MVTGTQCLEHIETGKHSECNAQMIKLNSSNHWELHGAIFAQILSDMSVKSVCAVANFEGHERCGDFDSLPFLFSHHSTFGRWPGTPAEGCCSISHAPGDVWGQHFSAFDGISVWRCTRTLNWWVKNFHAWRVIVSLDPSIPAGLGLVRSLPGVERGVSSDKTCAHWTPRGLDVTWSAWYPVGSNDVVLTSPPPPTHTCSTWPGWVCGFLAMLLALATMLFGLFTLVQRLVHFGVRKICEEQMFCSQCKMSQEGR